MENPQIEEVRGSRVVQGCLFGAVFIFVVLLGVLLVMGYMRFREFTAPDGPASQPAPVSAGPDATVPEIAAWISPG